MSRAVVTGGSKKDADAIAVLAMNLKDTNPGLADEMVIFHDGISKKKQIQMSKICPMRFIKYSCPIPVYKWIFNRSVRYFSTMVFCKFELLKLLDEYEAVLWTDYDVIFRDSIYEVWEEGGDCYSVVNHNVPLKDMFFDSINKVNNLTVDMNIPSVCTPLVVLKRGIGEYMKMYDWCYMAANRYIKYIYLPEQCIFTMMLNEFKVKIHELNQDIYCRHPSDAIEQTKILHAFGQPKFWNGLNNDEWNQYYYSYKEMK